MHRTDIPSTDTLITGCHLVDGVSDEVLPDASIWIAGERIRWRGAASQLPSPLPDDIRRLDLGGRYVLPGLFNMHSHFSLSLPGPAGGKVSAMSPHELALYMASGAARTLQAGVTSVRCVGEKAHADFALRAAIDSGLVPGPRIFTAGRPLACTGGHGAKAGSSLECDGADGFRRAVREQVGAGANLIKIMISGGIAGAHEKIDTPQLTREEIAAAISTAHDWGRRVTAHAGPAAIIDIAVELGLDCVEHGYQLTPEVVAKMVQRDTHLVPTLSVTRVKGFFDSLGVPEWMQQRSLDAGARHIESYQMALNAGVKVMLGSDVPPFWPIDETNATVRELEYMQEFGLSPMAAIRAATIVPATWLDAADDLGSLEEGKFADLMAVDEDPTADVGALRGVNFVMKSGAVVRG